VVFCILFLNRTKKKFYILIYVSVIAARIERVLLENKCEQCTPTQNKLVNKWVNVFVEKYPDLWRASMAKYAENLGIPLPPEERRKMIKVLGTYP
jgi:hypothetical protein